MGCLSIKVCYKQPKSNGDNPPTLRFGGQVARIDKPKDNGDNSAGVHLFPFRTEKLSPVAPMVLP